MPDHLSAYVLTVIAVSGTPGPVMMLALKAGTSHGRGAGVAVILASLAGSALVLAVVSAALATIASASAQVFLVLQIVFALYLVWIGIKSWPARPAESQAPADATPDGGGDAAGAEAPASRAIVRDAFLVALTNPKAYVFFAAVFSQFVHAGGPAAAQVAVLSVIFIAIDGIWQGVYLTVGRSLRLVDNARFHLALNRLVAVVFVLLGAFMAVESLRQIL